jgi:protein SCO1
LQEAIKADAALTKKARLLSVTLDPKFDTPAVLKSYAQNQDADPQIWSFATGAPSEIDKLTGSFSVVVQPQDGTIAHGLATALIGAEGKVVKIWRGNAWTPAEVIAELRKL